jgi:hypothetical protein
MTSSKTVTASENVKIEILDDSGAVEAVLLTGQPDWSFSQYCRNRPPQTRSWRPVA